MNEDEEGRSSMLEGIAVSSPVRAAQRPAEGNVAVEENAVGEESAAGEIVAAFRGRCETCTGHFVGKAESAQGTEQGRVK